MKFKLEIYGTQKSGRDSRLDFAFPDRVLKAEKIKNEKLELLEQAKKIIKDENMSRSNSADGKGNEVSFRLLFLVSSIKSSW